MNYMNHKVRDVQKLYTDASDMYRNAVIGGESSSDAILSNLLNGVTILKNTWKGKDAGVQIQNIITVYNELILIRNTLADWCVSAVAVAVNFRDIQNANGGGLETLSKISCEDMVRMSDYSDNTDTIDIVPEAANGKDKVAIANSNIDTFLLSVRMYYDEIMNNWTEGTGRNNADEMFTLFINNANRYKQTLAEITTSIENALQNYSF